MDNLSSLIHRLSNEWEKILDAGQNDKSRLGMITREFLHLVEKDFRTKRSPAHFASKLNQPISVDYLKKICQQVIEVSPTACIYKRIILESCIMLKDRNRLIKQIAKDLGFEQEAYFSRFFKNQVGQSPRFTRGMDNEIN